MRTLTPHAFALLFLSACAGSPAPAAQAPSPPKPVTFADDLAFLMEHTQLVMLHDSSKRARLLVAPEYQGRVLTSTNAGKDGPSFGFVHRKNIAKHERSPHINVFGGEDRFWLGPEAGQYGLFFAPGDPFDLAHWQTPEPIDWGGWRVTEQSPSQVRFSREMKLQNYAGTQFELRVERAVRVLERPALDAALGIGVPATLDAVSFESENTIRNIGPSAWTKDTGLLSIWILGMFKPGARNTVVLPYKPGPESELGPVVNDAYFGKVPRHHMRIGDKAVFFRGDGQLRSKIGLSRSRAMPIAGAYDADARLLTIVQFTLPDDARDYVNSMWEQQPNPYAGDVLNSYNDGPPAPGATPLGPFYEIETSSRAAQLAPGEALDHTHRTSHISGPPAQLSALAQRLFGVSLEQIEHAFDGN
jgi:hypothetical protein